MHKHCELMSWTHILIEKILLYLCALKLLNIIELVIG